MYITENNLIPLNIEFKQGQRCIKIGNSVIPVGVGGAFLPGSASDSSFAGLQVGVLVDDNGILKVQPLSFEGTIPSDSGSLQEYDLKIFNTSRDEPDYGGSVPVGSMDFYMCSSVVDLQGEAIATCAKGSSYTGWTVSGSLSTEVIDDIPAIKLTGGSYLYRTVSSIPQGTSARTLSAWVRAAAYTSDWMGVFGYGTDTSMKRFSLDIGSTGLPNVGLSWDSVQASDSVVGSWHHLCAVYEAGTVKLYVDGTLASSAAKSLDTSGTTLYVGYGVGSATTYRGYIANCRAYARALSEAQITALSREFTSGLSKTWSGRKAVLNKGVYSFQSDSTDGLTYNILKPSIGSFYFRDASAQVSNFQVSPSLWTLAFDDFKSGNQWSSKTGSYTMTCSNSLTASEGVLQIPYGNRVLGPSYTVGSSYMLSVIIKTTVGEGSSKGGLIGCSDGGLGTYATYWIYSTASSNRPRLVADNSDGKWHHIDVICNNGSYSYRYNGAAGTSGDNEYWSATQPSAFFMRCTTNAYSKLQVAFMGYMQRVPSSLDLYLADLYTGNIMQKLES